MLLNKINPLAAIGLLALSLNVGAKEQTLRDPTLPHAGYQMSVTTEETYSGLVLNSIINGPNSYAVINNKIMKVGDTVQGVRIVSIGKRQVNLADGRKLTLFQSVTER
ncbi:MSHA biogenesis protein MshK [Shewanella gaetbuli]|uniref:MSHA biogenesis protein MshK n=1 Tax=Shewanella gaetbuli TaxID=220752 RepID=A0A9X1ZIG1_9GAMM|nr:MSHA biogenesis protein MshK [Shewanella gaetbuli]